MIRVVNGTGTDGLLQNVLGQMQQYLNPDAYMARVGQAVDAQEGVARQQLESRLQQDMLARGIDPESPFAKRAMESAWAPYAGQFASARAGAGADYFRSLPNLAAMLLSMSRSGQGQRESSGGGGGGGMAPGGGWGGAIGTITNPEALSDWNHMPGGGWNNVRWDADAPGPNTRLNMYTQQKGFSG